MPGKNIRISIPAAKNSFFTIYAEGVSFGVFLRPERKEYDVFLDPQYPIILYFTFGKHRRAYICANPDFMQSNVYKFSCSNRSLSVISQLRGRAYDRFKRSLRFLCKHTDERCRKFDIRFYWQLAYLSKKGRNSNLNLKLLAEKYDTERNVALFEKQERKS